MTNKPDRPRRARAGRIVTGQRQISDHVHAGDEAFAQAQGWTVSVGTGRLGFGSRTYRDPRFDVRLADGVSSGALAEAEAGR